MDHAGRTNEAAFLRQKRCIIPVDHVNLCFYPSRRCLIAFALILNSYSFTTISRGRAKKRRQNLPKLENGKIKTVRSRAGRRREDLEEVSANEADEKDEGELPIQGANEDEEEDDSDEDEAEIRKATNCPIHASHS